MRFSTNPISAVVVGVLLVVAGLYLTAGGGTAGSFGWVLVAFGVLGIVGNLVLWRRVRS